MSPSSPSVYFVLGTPGSGRRAIVRDLVENGLGAGEAAVVLLADSEVANPAEERIAGLGNATITRWQWKGPDLPAMALPAAATVFLVADPLANAIDQLEALKPWLLAHNRTLARILVCVDCQLAEQQPVLGQWFEACIHFADVVFLTNREGVSNKWLSDFIQRFKSEFFPCHFIQVKKGDLANPALVLDPTPRRLTQYFDETEELPDVEIETDDEDDDEEADPEETGELAPEPYFLRQRSGRRVKELPDVREYLLKK